MKKRMLCLGIISLFLFTSVLPIYAFGKINTLSDDSLDEYTLYAPWYSKTIFLIDKNGEIVHEWKSDYGNYVSVYLTDKKNLLHCTSPGINPRFNSFGGSSGRIEILDWDGKIIWEFEYSNELHRLHHDVEILPNGNILMVAWEYKSYEEAINAGRKPSLLSKNLKTNEKELWPTKVIEVDNNKNIVWEWSLWDHIIQDYDQNKDNYGIVSEHPELVDINFAPDMSPDWIHVNSIDYNPQLDQIMLSCCHLSEIWIIDHSTTTEEAKGHTGGKYGRGGDLLYRWGNPCAYGFGDINDQKLFWQHDAQWIEQGCPGEGNILVFNNGGGRGYSSVDEITPPVDSNGNYQRTQNSPYGPESKVWIYKGGFSNILSGVQRLPDGNTLICYGTDGYFKEVNPDKEKVWDYNANNRVFKIQRYYIDLDSDNQNKEKDRINLINTFMDNHPIIFSIIRSLFKHSLNL